MSIQMMLEADENLTENLAREILSSLGVTRVEKRDDGFLAYFPQSLMPVHFTRNQKPARPFAPLSYQPKWLTNYILIIRIYLESHDLCYSQMRDLVKIIFERSSANFALSFQYEQVLADRQGKELKFYKSEWPAHIELPQTA